MSLNSYCAKLFGRSAFAVHRNFHRQFRAAFLKEVGKPLQIEESKPNRLRDSDIRVRVESCGVNFSDASIVSGRYHLKPPLPYIPGFEFSGEVIECGAKVKNFKPGERVLGLKIEGTGAFAEECTAHEDELYKIPHSLSYEVAASLPVAYGTALLTLDNLAQVEENNTILILTSQGSSGVACIDLAIGVYKCQVIAACENEAQCTVVRPKGVLATIDFGAKESISRRCLKLTKNAGVKYVIDTVGGKYFQQAMESIEPGGHIFCLSQSAGEIPNITVQNLMQYQCSVEGVWLGGFARRFPKKFHEIIEKVIGMLDEQFFEPSIAARFKLEQVNEALTYVREKKIIGKVILNIRP